MDKKGLYLPKHEAIWASFNVFRVLHVRILLDANVAALDQIEPISSTSTRWNADELLRVKNGKTQFSDKTGVLLVGLDIEANKDGMFVLLKRSWSFDIKREILGRLWLLPSKRWHQQVSLQTRKRQNITSYHDSS